MSNVENFPSNQYSQRMNIVKDLGEIENCPVFKAVPLHWEHEGKMLTSQTNESGESLDRGIINQDGKLLATVKPSYKLEQYSATFESLEAILVNSDLDLSGITREVGFSHDGGRMKCVYTLPSHKIDLGNGDTSYMEVGAYDSRDGCWSLNQFVGAIRILCLNSQVSISHISNYRAKHTASLSHEAAQQITQKCINEFTVQGDRWRQWKKDVVMDRQAMEIFWATVRSDKLPTDQSLVETLNQKKFLNTPSLKYLWDRWLIEKDLLGSNTWAIYNTLTHWSTHAPARNDDEAINIVDVKKRREEKIKKSFLREAA